MAGALTDWSGGLGADTTWGGAGADTFVFNFSTEGKDTTDFISGEDTIEVSAAGFGGGLIAGGEVTLVTAASAAAAPTGGADGYFIYSTGDKTIYWDANGGSGADASRTPGHSVGGRARVGLPFGLTRVPGILFRGLRICSSSGAPRTGFGSHWRPRASSLSTRMVAGRAYN